MAEGAGRIDVLLLGGTWNPRGDGISTAFARHLDADRFAPRFVEYPADYGRAMSYTESRAAGRQAMLAALDEVTGSVVLAGYSQGAAIAGDIAAEIGRGELPYRNVLACALIADPLRPSGRCVGTDPGGYGIAGERHVPGLPTYWAAAPGDPITALPAGNPLRSIADLTGYFSLASPGAALRWGRSLLDTGTRHAMQRWWSLEHRRSWTGAVAFARGYLYGGRHTDDYIRHGHVLRLAETINTQVRDSNSRGHR
ncbi:PE-PPE domain-containing protein [Nocardia shimofusensis]|uniref:PE-PPE domain-containing protein n=1 Tax=Nocardia shimofusensis TaxID=228596 RepID=UPI0014709E47|nr:PE-PPE domain-containing protein [Nocardia shimofusensis]